MLKNLKNNKKKGFTLVELIVVLVILAILAALLIPALTGYIDKAKEKSIIAETRQAVMAAQTLVDEEYGGLTLTESETAITITGDTSGTSSDKKVTKAEIATLGEVKADYIIGGTVSAAGKITHFVYSRDKMTCTYSDGKYTVTKGATTTYTAPTP